MGKIVEVQAPNLGQTGMDINIQTWFKKVGEHVEKGEALYELSNEKLSQEVESPATGTLIKINIKEGNLVSVGAILGEIEEN